MFILDKPYVSDTLKQTLIASRAPVLSNAIAEQELAGTQARLCSSEEFIRLVSKDEHPRLYSNSENALDWVAANLGSTSLPGHVALFKDKIRFREMLKSLYPGYFYQGVPFEELDALDPGPLPKPFIIKPSIGFFSLGVHKVASNEEWPDTLKAIHNEVAAVRSQYPAQVLDLGRFIIEECIDGEEFAVDAYFNAQGEPVILNILGHLFASEHDVNDRVYITSGDIIDEWRTPFLDVLASIGGRAELRNFPMHAELRIDPKRGIMPIEINPMRFAGWCCTDIALHAYGLNPYDYYRNDRHPDWDAILPQRRGKTWALVVADLPPDLDRSRIRSVDYEAFAAHFSNTLELRRIDYSQYSVFAFLFAECSGHEMGELTSILQSDLTEYLALGKD